MNNVGQVFWPHNCAAKSQPSGKLLESKRRASQEECHLDRAPAVPGSVPARSPDRPRKRPGSSAGRPGANLNLQTCTCKPALPWIETVETVFCTIEAVATKKSDKIGPGTNLHLQTCTSLDENITKIGYSRSQESAGLHSVQFCRFFSLRQLSCTIEPVTTNLHLQTCTCQPGLANLDWPPRVDPEIPLGPWASLGVHGGPTKPRRPRTSVPAAPVSRCPQRDPAAPRPRPDGPPRQPRFTAGTARVPSPIR